MSAGCPSATSAEAAKTNKVSATSMCKISTLVGDQDAADARRRIRVPPGMLWRP